MTKVSFGTNAWLCVVLVLLGNEISAHLHAAMTPGSPPLAAEWWSNSLRVQAAV